MDNIEVKSKYKHLLNQFEENTNRIEKMKSDLILLSNVKNLLMDFSEHTRSIIKNKLESLANSALKCIYVDKEIKFKIIVNKGKKIIAYDMYMETDGNLTPLTDAKGGGVMDIITTALRISFVRMFSATLRQTIIFDEPFKNLDSERLNLAVEWLCQVSKEFGMQFIMITHEDQIADKSDKVYRFRIENGVTNVEAIANA
jgi:DNA repair exonuclease SbcCD ATPase subunit